MSQPPMMPAQQISLLDIYTQQIKMGAKVDSLTEKLPDHENRIRSLEKWKYGLPLTGLLAAASIAFSAYEAFRH